jgi:hypothetical protein
MRLADVDEVADEVEHVLEQGKREDRGSPRRPADGDEGRGAEREVPAGVVRHVVLVPARVVRADVLEEVPRRAPQQEAGRELVDREHEEEPCDGTIRRRRAHRAAPASATTRGAELRPRRGKSRTAFPDRTETRSAAVNPGKRSTPLMVTRAPTSCAIG